MQEEQKQWKNEGRKEKQIVDIECGPAQLSLSFFIYDSHQIHRQNKYNIFHI